MMPRSSCWLPSLVVYTFRSCLRRFLLDLDLLVVLVFRVDLDLAALLATESRSEVVSENMSASSRFLSSASPSSTSAPGPASPRAAAISRVRAVTMVSSPAHRQARDHR